MVSLDEVGVLQSPGNQSVVDGRNDAVRSQSDRVSTNEGREENRADAQFHLLGRDRRCVVVVDPLGRLLVEPEKHLCHELLGLLDRVTLVVKVVFERVDEHLLPEEIRLVQEHCAEEVLVSTSGIRSGQAGISQMMVDEMNQRELTIESKSCRLSSTRATSSSS